MDELPAAATRGVTQATTAGRACIGRRVAVAALTVLLAAGCGPAATVGATDATPPGDAPETTTVPSQAPPSPAAAGATAPTAEASAPAVATADDARTVPDLTAALLAPEALPDPDDGFVWAIRRNGAAARPSAKLFGPCDPTDHPTDAERTQVRVRDLRVEAAVGGEASETAVLRQNVARYADADVAAEAIDGFLRAAEDCARTPGPDGASATTEVLTSADDRLLLQTTPEMGLSTIYTMAERRGDVVTLLWYYPGEMRDDDRGAQRVADAVTATLDAAG